MPMDGATIGPPMKLGTRFRRSPRRNRDGKDSHRTGLVKSGHKLTLATAVQWLWLYLKACPDALENPTHGPDVTGAKR